METYGDDRPQRMWRCCSKNGDIQVWERMNTTNDPQLRQRQFRFGKDARIRITTMIVEEQDIKEDTYEGGFTVWHGSLHAISYFVNLKEPEFAKLKGKRVMDLGCGNGTLGIFALKFLDAFEVYFQDLNNDVLQWSTRQNLLLNNIDPTIQIKMLHGNWDHCFDTLPKNTFNLILMSDTVYRRKNYGILHNALDYLLDKEPESKIYASGKSHYFGNDGGIFAFMEFVKKQGIFTAQSLDTDFLSVPHTLIVLSRIQPPVSS